MDTDYHMVVDMSVRSSTMSFDAPDTGVKY